MLLVSPESAIDNLFILEEQLISQAADFKLKLHRSPPGLRNHLKTLPPELIFAIDSNLGTMVQNLATCAETDMDPWDDRKFFTLSMRSLGFTFPNDFLDHVKFDDLVEGYNMQRFQIFRNMRYMEMINYSLMEVLSYEWPLLYDRAGAVTEKIIGYCDEILWAANKTIPFDVPKHYIRETRSQKQQYFEISFQYISPLFSGPNRPAGLLGAFRARSIELGKNVENNNLAFI